MSTKKKPRLTTEMAVDLTVAPKELQENSYSIISETKKIASIITFTFLSLSFVINLNIGL